MFITCPGHFKAFFLLSIIIFKDRFHVEATECSRSRDENEIVLRKFPNGLNIL